MLQSAVNTRENPALHERSDQAIKRACAAAVVCGSITLVVGLLALAGIQLFAKLGSWIIVDAAILFGLAFGVSKRSRICATILVGYGILSEVATLIDGEKPSPLRLIFLYFYVRGMLATFSYRRIMPRDALPAASCFDTAGVLGRRRFDAKTIGFVLVCLVSLFILSHFLGRASKTTAPEQSTALNLSELVQKAGSAVVLVQVYGANREEIATGSGFFISGDGTLVTNRHVIDNASSADAKLQNGKALPITRLIALDGENDLAVLAVDAKNLPYLTLGNSDTADIGSHIAIIGSPFGLEGTLSEGIVSGKRISHESGRKWLQLTAAISPGSSGSPVFNGKYQVVGVATMLIRGGEALNFAVPSNTISALLDKVKAKDESMPFPPSKSDVPALTARADNGDVEADVQLILLYHRADATAGITGNRARACLRYMVAKGRLKKDKRAFITRLAEAGFPRAQYDLGVDYLIGRDVGEDPGEAAKWFKRAADQQEAGAMTSLATLYREGTGVAKDFYTAAAWARKAANLRDPAGEFLLGRMYSNGEGMPEDSQQAEFWTLKAASDGDSDAQRVLAALYYIGLDRPRSYAEAAKWSILAARQGDPDSQLLLGELYVSGLGVPKDEILGYALAVAAANHTGRADFQQEAAASTKARLSTALSANQVQEAEALASTGLIFEQLDKARAEAQHRADERENQRTQVRPIIEAQERNRRFPPGIVFNLKRVTVPAKNLAVDAGSELKLIRENENGTLHVLKNNIEFDVPAADVTRDRDWAVAYHTLHAEGP